MASEIHTETSSLRTLKIMPRNLNKIVRSWIWLQLSRAREAAVESCVSCECNREPNNRICQCFKTLMHAGPTIFLYCFSMEIDYFSEITGWLGGSSGATVDVKTVCTAVLDLLNRWLAVCITALGLLNRWLTVYIIALGLLNRWLTVYIIALGQLYRWLAVCSGPPQQVIDCLHKCLEPSRTVIDCLYNCPGPSQQVIDCLHNCSWPSQQMIYCLHNCSGPPLQMTGCLLWAFSKSDRLSA